MFFIRQAQIRFALIYETPLSSIPAVNLVSGVPQNLDLEIEEEFMESVILKEDTICCRCGANINDGALNYSGVVVSNSKIKSGG